MELDKVTLPVVLRNLQEYDNQLSDTCTGFDHRFPRIALRGGDSIRPSAGQPFEPGRVQNRFRPGSHF